MDAQEIFDTAVRHMAKQGKPGGNTTDTGTFACQYRGLEGSRCAVGFFIPDETYVSSMEGNDAYRLIEAYGAMLPDWMPQNERLLSDLQGVHDSLPNWNKSSRMITELTAIARGHELSPEVLSTVTFPTTVKQEEV
jgi:hypothetical protein